MQKLFLCTIIIILDTFSAAYLNYDDDSSQRPKKTTETQEFEPITTISKDLENIAAKNINCDDFTRYAVNCTIDAALIYNSSRMSPPPTSKIYDWCKAIKYLTNCAIDWNTDCKDVSDSHFNEESIKGHIHVVNNICDDERFLLRYEELPVCIESSTDSWEACYVTFKKTVEEQKNTTQEWTHYEVHFVLCCARARFRRCTLESLFISPTKCTHEQAVTLQKFSVIVSEGGVYQNYWPERFYHRFGTLSSTEKNWQETQRLLFTNINDLRLNANKEHLTRDCDRNMMYENCPGGDPRPTRTMLKRLMSAESANKTPIRHNLPQITIVVFTISFYIQKFNFFY